MSSDKFKCQFCGAEQLKYETPYVELDSSGEYVPGVNYCCKAQQQNYKYVIKKFGNEDRPDPEEVGKEWN